MARRRRQAPVHAVGARRSWVDRSVWTSCDSLPVDGAGGGATVSVISTCVTTNADHTEGGSEAQDQGGRSNHGVVVNGSSRLLLSPASLDGRPGVWAIRSTGLGS